MTMNLSTNHSEPRAAPAPLSDWLASLVRIGGSDLHLVAGNPPIFRLHGDLIEHSAPPINAFDLQSWIRAICLPEVLAKLQSHKNVDFSYGVELQGERHRFRFNVFQAENHWAACARLIPSRIPDLDWAEFPEPLAERQAFLRDGLVILTGATGSGKTTTLAMIVNRINLTGGYRIITVEEPIEYVYPRAPHSLVSQREVGADVLSFADGLKYGLRQDPDVILVGEIRDRDTAQMALSASETGHLVFTTLHSRDAKGAVTRMVDLFPQDAQRDVRAQVALGLRAVVSQRLLPGLERGAKRHLALEVLWNTHPIAAAIRQGKFESIDNYLVTSRDEGMLSFDESIRQLYWAGKISLEMAEHHIRDPAMLRGRL